MREDNLCQTSQQDLFRMLLISDTFISVQNSRERYTICLRQGTISWFYHTNPLPNQISLDEWQLLGSVQATGMGSLPL